MPCLGRGTVRIRAKDVGRKGHHYIKIAVLKKKGPRGGRTRRIGKLRTYKRKKRHSRRKPGFKGVGSSRLWKRMGI